MSYDLDFISRNGVFGPESFIEYFRAREHYQIYQIGMPQFFYENKDTDVYFVFQFEGTPESPQEKYTPMTLNVNYFRPSYFILEAEPEVTAFVCHFDLLIFDSQTHGNAGEVYQKDLLISGWNHGNEFAYAALLSKPASREKVATLPTATLMEIWRWNRGRHALDVGDKFVPRIFFIQIDGRVCTAAVWPDGIPTVIPRVDYLIVLIVPRKELAPEGPLGTIEDRALLAWEDARPILERHRSTTVGNAIVPDYDLAPGDVVSFIRSLPPDSQEIVAFPTDRVLDRELVEKYAR